METISFALFLFLGALIIASSVGTVWAKNPVSSALFLILNFFALGGIYLLLEAQFIAVVQVIVYAGAIMVLFLFTIMLLNLDDERALTEKFDLQKGFGVLLGGALLVELLYVLGMKIQLPEKTPAIPPSEIGAAKNIGRELITNFLFPFEIVSVLLLLAIIGAIVLAKKNFPNPPSERQT
ncbi:MAG: NADH-quinone oxidoreductase subunit J [Chloroherpetonaceae bacterium]|nr:NADH-quinone oxidoreductase subunit J [Chloroherpetonaceae bacterium]MDW8437821.1 NADH-quinone oxidoreductase subunit J [Chloroherpetonaceae bacterium]